MKNPLVTDENTKALWDYFAKKYSIRVKDKSKSWVMRKSGRWVDRLGYMYYDSFMENYYTTVCYPWYLGGKDYIYVPSRITIGEGSYLELCKQMEVVTHEVTHVIQQVGILYLLDSDKIATTETEAYCCDMEMHHYLTGNLKSASLMANLLKAYGCNIKQINYAVAKYNLCADMVDKGVYKQSTVKQAIRFLESL